MNPYSGEQREEVWREKIRQVSFPDCLDRVNSLRLFEIAKDEALWVCEREIIQGIFAQ